MVLSKACQKCKERNQNPSLLYNPRSIFSVFTDNHGLQSRKRIITAKNLLEIPHVGAQQCRPECGKQALYQAVFWTELKLAMNYRAKKTMELGRQGSRKPQRTCAGHNWPRLEHSSAGSDSSFSLVCGRRASQGGSLTIPHPASLHGCRDTRY